MYDIMISARNTRLFYGWYIVGAVFLLSGTAAGLIYAFSVFFEEISHSFNASRAEVSLIFSGAEFVWFLSGFLGGYLADRFGPRRVVLGGALLMAAGLFLASQATTLAGIVLAYAIGVGIGGGFIYIPAISLVPRWFRRRRGLASGFAICGVGAGTFAFPILGKILLDRMGWDGAHVVFAGIAVAICGSMAFFLITSPATVGLGPDGDPVRQDEAGAPAVSGYTLGEAIRSRAFWQFYVACLLTSAVIFTTYVHLIPYAIDHGNDRTGSVALLGVVGVASIAGRFLFGGLSDRIGGKRTISLMSFGMAAAVAWWLLSPPSLGFLYVYTVIFGAFYGGYISVLPVLAMIFFGGRHLSTIIGALYTSWGVGALIGPTMTGYFFDVTQDYSTGFVTLIIFLCVASAISFFVRDHAESF
ncbi:MFS transporter [Pelagibius sp. Alg239-R121]|uniref:MFS transporter n=1 Tax=Pelagibius sp. Alg239-R121 TaxID=2993448 RepID=UPI0024A62CB2|nr:MFS transporter [Pelagibius sp. Alg239-R121]